MAGWSAAYDAVFAKYGFIVSNDLDEAVTIAAVLATNPLPKGDRVAVLTVSGGGGIWGAEPVSIQGLKVPELSPAVQAQIRAMDAVLWRRRQSDRCHRPGAQGGFSPSNCSLISDEVDAILVVLSLFSDTRMSFKPAELAPVIAAQKKPVVFYSYTLPSAFARGELAKARRVSAIGSHPCRGRDAAAGRLCQFQPGAAGGCCGHAAARYFRAF